MKKSALLALGALALGSPVAQAESGPYVGFNKTTLKGQSDTIVGVPFDQKPGFVGALGSAPSISGDNATLTPSLAPSWTIDQFVSPTQHYVRILSGAKQGFWYKVVSNTATSVTVVLNGDSVGSVATSDRISLVPFWTLNTVFPNGQGVYASASAGSRRTEILIIDPDSIDINKGASKTYYYRNSAWRLVGDITGNHDNDILIPQTAFIVRHNRLSGDPSPQPDTVLCIAGRVPVYRHAIQLDVGSGNQKNDNWVSIDRPIPVTLAQSGLTPSVPPVASDPFVASPSAGNRTDELFVFDNTQADYNKGAFKTYYYRAGAWRLVGDITGNHDNDLIFNPGEAVVIRKSGTGTGSEATKFLQNNPTY